MYKIKIISVGKTKEAWLEAALSIYLKRLKPYADFEFQLARHEEQLAAWIEKETDLICLDAAGPLFDSPSFSKFFFQQMQRGGSRLTFLIGGAEGIPAAIKSRYPLLSLSPMTFTHQMVRLLLIEQIYRAFEIEKGSPYHK